MRFNAKNMQIIGFSDPAHRNQLPDPGLKIHHYAIVRINRKKETI